MSGRPETAIKFLQFAFPDGPWKLSAILPQGVVRSVPTRTFTPDSEAAAKKWIADMNNSGANVYFELGLSNPEKAAKKSSKDDVTAARCIAVDIDCGRDKVREVLSKIATGPMPKGIPRPSAIIDSGNGVWPIWLLNEPADPANAEVVARGLTEVFSWAGADRSCWNRDRIARLPGTINYPDEKKRKAGAVEVLAGWSPLCDGRAAYSLNDFPSFAATDPDRSGRAEKATGAGSISSLAPVANLSDLGLDPDNGDALAAMIVTGHPKDVVETGWPTEPPPKGGRSETVHAVACELVRRGVAPEKIAEALTHPDWSISAHVREQKPADRYAIRQVNRALEKVAEAAEEAVRSASPPPDPKGAVRWMNLRHFVLEVDGKECVVASLLPSDIAPARTEVKVQSFTALKQRYCNRRVETQDAEGNVKLIPLGDFWLSSPARRQFLRVMFRPGEEPEVNGCYNLWQGFGFDAEAGDWSLMKAHIRDVLAGGDPVAEDYILRWAAYAVQNLSGPQGVVLAFRGGKGSGKGTFARALADLFGQHGLHIASSDLLTGRFNGHLEDCCLVFADEAIRPGDNDAESRLKGLTTEPVLALEAKGRDARPVRNHLKIVMASNEDWIAPASWDERRYAVFDVSHKRVGDKRYFDQLNAQLGAGGRAAMLADLLAMDLGDWRPGDAIPDTEALRAQKERSLEPEEAWLLAILESGEIPGEWPYGFGPYCRPSKWRLGRDGGLMDDMRRSGRFLSDRSDQALGRFLGKWLDRYTTGTARGWRFPALADLRAKWEAKHGPREWPEGVVEWPVESFDRVEGAARDLPF